jgi:hypothetical protein
MVKKYFYHVKYQVLAAVIVINTVFWNVTPCSVGKSSTISHGASQKIAFYFYVHYTLPQKLTSKKPAIFLKVKLTHFTLIAL